MYHLIKLIFPNIILLKSNLLLSIKRRYSGICVPFFIQKFSL